MKADLVWVAILDIYTHGDSKEHTITPYIIIKRDQSGGCGVFVWGSKMLGTHTDFHIFEGGSITGARYCNEIWLPYVYLFSLWVLSSFSWTQRPISSHTFSRRAVGEWRYWMHGLADEVSGSKSHKHVWDFLQRHLAAHNLSPVKNPELWLVLQEEWAAMPQPLIDNLITQHGQILSNLQNILGRSHPLLKVGCFLPVTWKYWPSVTLWSMSFFQFPFFVLFFGGGGSVA